MNQPHHTTYFNPQELGSSHSFLPHESLRSRSSSQLPEYPSKDVLSDGAFRSYYMRSLPSSCSAGETGLNAEVPHGSLREARGYALDTSSESTDYSFPHPLQYSQSHFGNESSRLCNKNITGATSCRAILERSSGSYLSTDNSPNSLRNGTVLSCPQVPCTATFSSREDLKYASTQSTPS